MLEALPAALDLLQLGPGPAGAIAEAVLTGGAKRREGLLPLLRCATASGDRELLGLLLASYFGRGAVVQVGGGGYA